MSENRVVTQDLMPIAAKFAGALYRDHNVVLDPEVLCRLFTRLHLSPPSAPAPMPTDSYSKDVESGWSISHSVTHTGGSGSCMSYTAPRGHSTTAQYVRRASLHDALDQFCIALKLGGPLTVDDATWVVTALVKVIMAAAA